MRTIHSMMTLLSRIKYVNEATITKPHMNFWFEDSKLYIYNKNHTYEYD